MPFTSYSQDEVDQAIADATADMYSQDDVDALFAQVWVKINGDQPNPPQPMGKIIGSGDMTAFRGLKLSGHRTYNGFGAQRQYNPQKALALVQADAQAGRRSYFSIGNGNNKAHPGGPQDWPTTLTGLPVDQFVPTAKVVQATGGVLILHHEPEDDPGNPQNFKTWFGLMSDYYRNAIPGIRIGLCLMAWSGRQGGPGFPRWTPDTNKFDVFCIDGYAHQVSDGATGIFGNALGYARSLKKPLMICETGQENNVDQIPFLASMNQFATGNTDVEGWLYWNGGNGDQAKGGHNYHLQPDALAVYGQMVQSGQYARGTKAV